MVEKARQIREVMLQITPVQRTHTYAFCPPMSTIYDNPSGVPLKVQNLAHR